MTASAERSIGAVLLDLDGTLADTAPDMTGALNLLRVEQGRDPLPPSIVRPHVSHGAKALIRIGFGDELEAAEHESLRRRFLELYAMIVCRDTRVFSGFDAVLDELDSRALRWGIVTNKPGWLGEPLVEQLELRARAACLVCGDSVARNKPDPMPLIYAAELLALPPQRCIYVGDAERDIVAGRAAGMPTLVAGWGYLSEHDRPEQWGADGIVVHPAELLDWIEEDHWKRHAL